MRLLVLISTAALMAVSCSGDPTSDDFVASLTEARSDLSEADARCIVTELKTSYSDAELAELTVHTDDVDVDDRALFAERQFAAVKQCDLESQVNPGLVDAFATANGLDEDAASCAVQRLQEQFGFWELTEQLGAEDAPIRFQRRQFEAIFACGERNAVVEQLVPQLVEQGVGTDDAPCVADEIATRMDVSDLGVLYSGQMTDSFYSLYFGALEACSALPADS